MLSKDFTISNILGLHVRASNKLVECANSFISEVDLLYNDQKIDAKRILQVMTLGAKKNDTITIFVYGADADAAFAKISELIESGFGENKANIN